MLDTLDYVIIFSIIFFLSIILGICFVMREEKENGFIKWAGKGIGNLIKGCIGRKEEVALTRECD